MEIPSKSVFSSFLRHNWRRCAAISAAIVVPCLWHPRIEAGDLASHIYNAWLAHLIRNGQAPGLVIARQWNNVLFDLALSGLGGIVGLRAAETIATAAAVLIFFWGAFALICAMMPSPCPLAPSLREGVAFSSPALLRDVPWFLLPCLAMFTYGWSFEMGFMNYYLSIGLAFFALALLKFGLDRKREVFLISAIVLVPLIWLAHPLGLMLLMSVGAYLLLAQRISPRNHNFLFAAAVCLLLGARYYLQSHYPIELRAGPRMVQDGTDQLQLYGRRYLVPVHLLQLFSLVCLLLDVWQRTRRGNHRRQDTGPWWLTYLLPLELYALGLSATVILPSGILVPQFAAPVELLTERLSSISAILACCLLGVIKPRKWHLAGFAAIAAIFFFLLYRDTGTLNRMEAQVEGYVRLVPPGTRVVATLWPLPGSRVLIHHMVDRACIARCFSYDNYEPSSKQFRVRTRSAGPVVMANAEDANNAVSGSYIVRPEDLPLFQIYQYDSTRQNLRMRELSAGEANGRIGVHPPGF